MWLLLVVPRFVARETAPAYFCRRCLATSLPVVRGAALKTELDTVLLLPAVFSLAARSPQPLSSRRHFNKASNPISAPSSFPRSSSLAALHVDSRLSASASSPRPTSSLARVDLATSCTHVKERWTPARLLVRRSHAQRRPLAPLSSPPKFAVLSAVDSARPPATTARDLHGVR